MTARSLNPCSNGIWSRTRTALEPLTKTASGLNPCFNGIWSRTPNEERGHCPQRSAVLILVLMEYGLEQPQTRSYRGFTLS